MLIGFWLLLKRQVIFPGNFLQAFFEPWASTPVPGWEHGIPHKPLGFDNIRYFYPIKKQIADAVRQGQWPLWNNYDFSGSPLAGDGQSAVFYPLTLLYVILPLPVAFTVMPILAGFLGIVGMYWLLRVLKLSPVSAGLGAGVFVLSGYTATWIAENPAVSQASIWLPFCLAAFILWVESGRRRYLFWGSLAVAMMLTAGFLQVGIYGLALIAAAGVKMVFAGGDIWGKARRVGLFMALGIGLAAVSWLPVVEGWQISARETAGAEVVVDNLVNWSHLLSLLVPDWLGHPGTYNYLDTGALYDKALFFGLLPFWLVAVYLLRRTKGWRKLFKIVFTVSLFMGIDTPVTRWIYLQRIPIFSTMIPTRIFYLTMFSGAVLSAFGWEEIIVRRQMKIIPWRGMLVIFAGLALAILGFVLAIAFQNLAIRDLYAAGLGSRHDLLQIVVRNSVFYLLINAVILFCFWWVTSKKSRHLTIWLIILVMLSTVASLYHARKSWYTTRPDFVFPGHRLFTKLRQVENERLAYLSDQARIKSNIHSVFGLASPEGLNPVYPARYGQLVMAADSGGQPGDLPRIDIKLDLESKSGDGKVPAHKQRLLALLAVKYLLGRTSVQQSFVKPGPIVWQDGHWVVYRYPGWLPRARFYTHYELIGDQQLILSRLYAANFEPDRSIILEKQPDIPVSKIQDLIANVEISRITSSSMELAVTASQSGLVYVVDNYAPGWRAEVDGVAVPLYRANYTFRAVAVSSGVHRVILWYWPSFLTLGLGVTFVSSVCLGVAVFLGYKHRVSEAVKTVVAGDRL